VTFVWFLGQKCACSAFSLTGSQRQQDASLLQDQIADQATGLGETQLLSHTLAFPFPIFF